MRWGQGSTEGDTNNWWVGQPNAANCTNTPQSQGNGIVLDCQVASGDNVQLLLTQLLPGPSNPDDTFNVFVIPAGSCT